MHWQEVSRLNMQFNRMNLGGEWRINHCRFLISRKERWTFILYFQILGIIAHILANTYETFHNVSLNAGSNLKFQFEFHFQSKIFKQSNSILEIFHFKYFQQTRGNRLSPRILSFAKALAGLFYKLNLSLTNRQTYTHKLPGD